MAKKFSDIKTPKTKAAPPEEPKSVEKRPKKEAGKTRSSVPDAQAVRAAQPEDDLEKIDKWFEKFERKEVQRFAKEDAVQKRAREQQKKLVRRILVFSLLGLAVSGALLYGAAAFFSRVTVALVMEEFPFQYHDEVVGSASASVIDGAKKTIPAEVFSVDKNETRSFLASGQKYTEHRAQGVITVYNAYSSFPQQLVATTRFAAPDGKIFRLNRSITVPGAKIEKGVIIPSYIDVAVTADKPGESYNIGPTATFTIPGFSGTKKFNGFYGSSAAPMTGGFVGQIAAPTDQDIARAKTETISALKADIRAFLVSQIPKEFTVLDSATRFETGRTSVNSATNDSKEFTVTVSGKMSAIAFKEADIQELMASLAAADLKSKNIDAVLSLKSGSSSYQGAAYDFAKKQIALQVNFDGAFWQPADAVAISKAVRGKKESEIRAIIYGVPMMKKATIAFWPRFIRTAPLEASRVRVVIE